MCYFLKGEAQDYYVNAILDVLKELVPIADRILEESEDGEVVVGYDASGEVVYWLTFNPQDRIEIDKHIELGTLAEYVQSHKVV